MQLKDFAARPLVEEETRDDPPKTSPTPEHQVFSAGIPPYLRGPYATMYTTRPWTIRQYAGFSSAEESNRFYKDNLAMGQKGLSVAFDLPTHRGYDSDHPRVAGDVGKAGVAIDTVEDMKILFKGIPLQEVSVSMTMNGAVLPILAFFIVAAEEEGVPAARLSGTIQNDILKEFMVRNTYIYPPRESMRIVGDIFAYLATHAPKFNPISISGYHMQEAGAPADLELAYTLANGLEYVRTGLRAGLAVDDFAPRLSFFWGIGMNHFLEIAKLRAARVLWAKLMHGFHPKNKRSMMLRAHAQTSGWSLCKQDPYNNVGRTMAEAMAAVFGHTQSLHTNALDEALALPTPFSARIARNTQLYLQHETNLTKVIDPWGGSHYVEGLTEQLVREAWDAIKEVEAMGGMTEALLAGLPKARIEEAALAKQLEIDKGEAVLIGVNRHAWHGEEPTEDLLFVDTEAVADKQRARMRVVREGRNEARVREALHVVTRCAAGTGNLLEASLNAARARATLGETSNAVEEVFGRYEANQRITSGLYISGMRADVETQKALAMADAFAKAHGRRPRVLLAKMGQDGHDRGFKVVAAGLSDVGFDVDLAPLFQTPEEVARQAIENDVHFVGISTLSGAHKVLIPLLITHLKKWNSEHILVFAGGIIPQKDHDFLMKKGVIGLFGPGSLLATCAQELLKNFVK